MITLSTFQAHLSSQAPLPKRLRSRMDGKEEQQLLKWTAKLPMQSQDEQISQLETILTELSVSEVDDPLRLRMMSIVMTAADRLIANLRQCYIYEVGPLSREQLHIMNQVKSLHYLSVLVYDGVIRRERAALDYQQHATNTYTWRRFIRPEPAPPFNLANALYHSLLAYQKLLLEKAICYQPSPSYIWSALNRLYRLACVHQVAHTDLTLHVMSRQASTIHQLYSQACLHSLLNVVAMRRPNILLVHRLLPEWAAHISATLEPQTRTRLFVDLESERAPEYLTTATSINPYKADAHCLFIELEPLAMYLRQRQEVLIAKDDEAAEYRLVTEVLMALTHRYISRQAAALSNYRAKKRATVVVGFSNIHYRVAGRRSLMTMIAPQSLPMDQLPNYDTAPKKDNLATILEIELPDCPDAVSSLKTLRLLTAQDIAALDIPTDLSTALHERAMLTEGTSAAPPKLTEIFEATTTDDTKLSEEEVRMNLLATAPPRLKSMSLFLLSPHPEDIRKNWALGVVRWLTIDDQYVEAEAQILGHAPTACALRLDNRDNRSQRFVPALLLAREETLQTMCSLLVPSYQFKINDRVVIRLNDQQKSLRLQRRLLSTERFTQYEVVHL